METIIDNVIVNGTLGKEDDNTQQGSAKECDMDRLIETCVEQIIERLSSMQAR